MRILLIAAALAALLGCGTGALLAPSAGVRASTAPAAAICGCSERYMPTYAQWRESHRMWSCTVVLPTVGGAPSVPCTAWGLDRAPVGFAVQVD